MSPPESYDVISLEAFQADAAAFIERVREGGNTLILSANGENGVVLLAPTVYEQLKLNQPSPLDEVPNSAPAVAMACGLVHDFPELMPVLQQHLDDWDWEVLPSLLMSAIVEALASRVDGEPAFVQRVVDWVEAEFDGADDDVGALVRDSFVEMLPMRGEQGTSMLGMLGPLLRAEAIRQGHWKGLL
jgi:hypothetical protein